MKDEADMVRVGSYDSMGLVETTKPLSELALVSPVLSSHRAVEPLTLKHRRCQ